MFFPFVRRTFALLQLLLIGVILAACGGAPTLPGNTASQAQATAPAIVTESVPAAEAADTGATGATSAAGTVDGTTAPAGGELVVYSGRNKELVGPLIERFQQETGTKVSVRYGETSELAATILEEGANSPADVFFAQDAGALGALAKEDALAPLPPSVLEQVPARFRSPEGLWTGLSGRARVVVYNNQQLAADDMPASIRDFTDARWKGKIGWAPTNASFQAFVTAMRRIDGDERTREWLRGIKANEPKVYKNNTAVVEAVAAGEVQVGFVNHYYLMRLKSQKGESYPATNHFFSNGDVGSLVNVAGVAILKTSDTQPAAEQFVNYLLNAQSQQFFASETFEYPVANGVAANPGMPALDQIQTPELDLSRLDDLEATLELLRAEGVL